MSTNKGKNVVVTRESDTGRNTKFLNTKTNETMTRPQFVNQIENGKYQGYHVREINDIKTPVSNPDKKTNNNLN